VSRKDTPSSRRPGAARPGGASTRARVLSAWAAFLAIVAAIWVGLPALIPIYLIFAGVALFEYSAMLRLRNIRVHRTGLLAATALHVPVSLPSGHPASLETLLGMPSREALALGFLLIVLTVAIRRPYRDALETVAFTLLGYLWIPAFFSYLLTLRASPDGTLGLGALLLPALAVVASDVGAYLAGSTLGRRPLSPVLSPDKTIEGAIGGLALAALVTPTAAWLLDLGPGSLISPWLALPFGLAIAAVSQAGDLFESLVKRRVGVKDAGLFLPGQGGVLDRIDSHLFALPVAYLILSVAGRL